MSTITSEYFEPSIVAISARHRRRFWQTECGLKNWKISIGNSRRGDWKPHRVHNAWASSSDIKDDLSLPPSTPANTQTTSIVFGHLYLHVASSEIPNVVKRFAFPEAVTNVILKQIWPARPGTIRWPPRQAMNDRDADNVAGFLYLSATGLFWKTPTRAP
jgi:hypothetical protein